MNIKSIKSGQKGMILLETIAGVAISSIILSAVVGLIYHEIITTSSAKDSITATQEIDSAIRCISSDIMMAENSNLLAATSPIEQLNLSWMERYEFSNIPHNCTYQLVGTELKRDYDGVIKTIARDISSIAFSQVDNVITITICCTPSWRDANTVERTFRVSLRTTIVEVEA
ncbi:hypothetical protein ACFLTT_00370 [Chloroflexota bacterium]